MSYAHQGKTASMQTSVKGVEDSFMGTRNNKSFLAKISALPQTIDLTHPATPIPHGAKTAPGQLAEYLVKESHALRENERLSEEMAVLKSMLVPLDKLTQIAGRKRVLDPVAYAQLKANIEKNGVNVPIVIRPAESGLFEIISGHNRVQICHELGLTSIFAVIRDLSSIEAERSAFYINLMQSSLPDYEKYIGFKKLMAYTGQTQSEIATESGISKTHISFLMAFDELPREGRDLIAKNPACVGAGLVYKLKGLPKIMEALNAIILNGVSQAQALIIAADKPKPGKVNREKRVLRKGKTKLAEVDVTPEIFSFRVTKQDYSARLVNYLEPLAHEWLINNVV